MIEYYKSRLLNKPELITELEERFTKLVIYLNTPHVYAIAVDSCTNGLAMCLEYCKPKRVSIPAMTFASVANEIVHSGAILKLDTRYEVGSPYLLTNTHIVDAAHYNPQVFYGGEHKVVYSFFPNKVIPSYEGGMITTTDKDFADWAKAYRQCGRDGYGYNYDIVNIGKKYNMNCIQAKEAIKSLQKLPKILEVSEKQRKYYSKYLPQFISAPYCYIVKVKDNKKAIKELYTKGIQCSIHFKPLYDMTAYKEYPKLKLVEELKNHILSLPLHPYLTKYQQGYIIKCVKEYLL